MSMGVLKTVGNKTTFTKLGRHLVLWSVSLLLAVTFISPTRAMTLDVVGGSSGCGAACQVPGDFSLTLADVAIGDEITVFDNGNSGAGTGLELLGSGATLVFEFLGSSAGNTNTAFSLLGGVFELFNNADLVGTTGNIVMPGPGFVPFKFTTSGGGGLDAVNAGTIEGGLAIAYAAITETSVIALFGDGAGDNDYDDLAVRISVQGVSPVPLPAAVWLFLTAIVGLVSFARVRRA